LKNKINQDKDKKLKNSNKQISTKYERWKKKLKNDEIENKKFCKLSQIKQIVIK
jgi:hypothetical protein